jgi:hypothetical protein
MLVVRALILVVAPARRIGSRSADFDWVASGMTANRLTTRGASQKDVVDVATPWS